MWSIKKILKQIHNTVLRDEIKVEILGDWDNWQNAYTMDIKVKNNEIKVWQKELLIENIPHEYKFKIEGLWALDPYRRLSEKNPDNHFIDPKYQMVLNLSSETSICENLDIYNVTVRELEIKDMLISDLWGHSMNLVKDQLYIIGGVGRNSFQNILYQIEGNF